MLRGIIPYRLRLIKSGRYEAFTSSLFATGELTDEPDGEKRLKMLALILEYGINVLFPTDGGIALIRPAWQSLSALPRLFLIGMINYRNVKRK